VKGEGEGEGEGEEEGEEGEEEDQEEEEQDGGVEVGPQWISRSSLPDISSGAASLPDMAFSR
jgi:hypothetical protein